MRVDFADLYGEDYVREFESSQTLDRLRRLLHLIDFKPHSVVADFGCGNGMLMELIAPSIQEYVGVDFSQHFIESANRKRGRLGISNAKFVCARIENFCAEYPEHFDVALAMDLSEHVPDEEWTSILASIRSSLKREGRIYVHTPNADFFLERLKSKNFLVKQFKEHVAVRTASQNAEILESAGYSKVEISFLPHYNLLKYLHPISFLPGLGRFFQARLFLSASK